MTRVLSIDGGGIRGIIPATIITELEHRAGKPINQIFDLIAGNSTGGIIATALAAGIPARKVMSLYGDRGGEIFSNPDLMHGAIRPKYSPAPLEAILQSMLSGYLSDIKGVELLVPAQRISPDIAYGFFNTWEARKAPEKDYLLWQVARSTSAAETYFPPSETLNRANACEYFTDGGTFCNNPSAAAWAAASRELWPGQPIELLSIGCGAAPTGGLNGAEAQGWGAVGWLIEGKLIDLCLDGNADQTAFIMSALGFDHDRLQAHLEAGKTAMDDASPENIGRLVDDANDVIAAHSDVIDRFAGGKP